MKRFRGWVFMTNLEFYEHQTAAYRNGFTDGKKNGNPFNQIGDAFRRLGRVATKMELQPNDKQFKVAMQLVANEGESQLAYRHKLRKERRQGLTYVKNYAANVRRELGLPEEN